MLIATKLYITKSLQNQQLYVQKFYRKRGTSSYDQPEENLAHKSATIVCAFLAKLKQLSHRFDQI